MSRIRIDDSAEYWWSLPCSLLRDSRLSYEARGVACHLLSLARIFHQNEVGTALKPA